MAAAEVILAVKTKLLIAESEHENSQKGLEGFERVLIVLHRLRVARESRAEHGKDTVVIDAVLEESHRRLETILELNEKPELPINIDFTKWAVEIESNIRIQGPLLSSFNTGSEAEAGEEQIRSLKCGRLSHRESSVSSKGGSTLLHILKSNGKLQQKSEKNAANNESDDGFFFFTTVAWAFAVLGMMITIGFLTADFLEAQDNVAVQIVRSKPQPMELPAVTMCNDVPNIPSFSGFPDNNYPGLPLFGILRYVHSKRNASASSVDAKYPKTLAKDLDSPIEDVIVSEHSSRLHSAPLGFDVLREQESLFDISFAGSKQSVNHHRTRGLHCFRMNRKVREMVEPHEAELSGDLFMPAVQVAFFKSRLLQACRSRAYRNIRRLNTLFSSELLRNASGLEARKILDFSGYNFSVLGEIPLDLGAPKPLDFYCNVYFFSGFFYPSVDNANISYRYDPQYIGRWRKVGSGPYYSPYTWEPGAEEFIGPDTRALNNDTYVFTGVSIFAEVASQANEGGVVSPERLVAVIDSTQNSIVTFSRVNADGREEFRVKKGSGADGTSSTDLFDMYKMSMDFSSFETETILTTPTMSWPEFLTDVFEFVGLFTGICIFTLIVAPAHSLV